MNWQTPGKFTQKRRDSLRPIQGGVISEPAIFGRFLASFRENHAERPQALSGLLENFAAPAPRQRNEGLTITTKGASHG